MKTLILAIALVVGFSVANAGVTCSTDYFGNTTCRGTGSDSGQTWNGSKDYFGNETWRSNDGQTYNCSTDYFGTTTCN